MNILYIKHYREVEIVKPRLAVIQEEIKEKSNHLTTLAQKRLKQSFLDTREELNELVEEYISLRKLEVVV